MGMFPGAMPEAHARRLLLLLVGLAVLLTALVIQPLWRALFLAAVLAAALHPPMERVAALLGGRRKLSAALLVVAVLLVVLLPVAWFGAVVIAQAIQGVAWLRDTLQSRGVAGLIERLPDLAQRGIHAILERVPELQAELGRIAGQRGTEAAAKVGGLIAATGTALFKAAMTLIALFFFLADGRRLLAWLEAQVPLLPGQFRALTADFRQTSVSVLLATLGTGVIQSGAAVAGYLLAGAPSPVFLGIVTFFVALVPLVGASMVVLVVALLLAATGHLGAGLFLAAWALGVVAVVDNVARPWLLKGRMELHGGLVFFSLVGAIGAFGAIGLIAGPLVVTFLVTVLRLYRRETAS
jgi:predicted PurR-regulated permease PerM